MQKDPVWQKIEKTLTERQAREQLFVVPRRALLLAAVLSLCLGASTVSVVQYNSWQLGNYLAQYGQALDSAEHFSGVAVAYTKVF